jgi:hypothetical protein
MCLVLAVTLAACGAAPPTTTPATLAPTPTPSASPSIVPSRTTGPVVLSPTAPFTATHVPANTAVWVGNTDGQGVHLRRTPAMADRIQPAYPDGTRLLVVGNDETGDGQQWRKVRAPDGVEGYVPFSYTLAAQPTPVVSASLPVATTVPVAPPNPTASSSTPVPAAPPAQPTCGAPSNPWGYNLCGKGAPVRAAPSNLCSYFPCIPSFWRQTSGYVAQCADGMFSHSGGARGACSGHGGLARALNAP